jgi:aminomethyltransferase
MKFIALNEKHQQLGAKMLPFAGYNMPIKYTSEIEEHLAVRQSVGLFDVSHMGEFILSGNRALDLIQYTTSNDASVLENGKVQYSCLPNGKGGIVDDLLVYCLEKNQKYLLVVNASNIEKDWNWLSAINQEKEFGVQMENISDSLSLFALQGPKAPDLLQNLTQTDVKNMKYYTFDYGNINHIPTFLISATGYTGAGGFEIYVKNENALALWDTLMAAGQELGIKPVGLAARDTLRLEMGYCLYGNDIDDTTSPLEAGLGWITKFSKDFIDADKLKKQKEQGVTKKLIGFEMIEKGIPRKDYDIVNEAGNIIGKVTSGTISPSMKVGIGLGYVATEYAKPETPIFIQIRQGKVAATVKKLPLLHGSVIRRN